MKKQIASLFVALATVVAMALPGWGASHTRSIGPENQFHLQPKKGRSPAYDRIQARLASAEAARQERLAKMGILPTSNGKPTAAGKLKPHRNTSGQPSTVGFVAATEIPAGGFLSYTNSTNPVLSGDFNGDGKKDLVTLVELPPPATGIAIAVSLGNGDGTFGGSKTTAISADDAFVIGDTRNNGQDDVLVVHGASSTGGGTSSVDVFLSNGDGTFTFGNNYPITANDLAGGLLYDINGDGKLDIVAVDSANPANVWVALGNGDGTFQTSSAVTQLSGEAGTNMIFADFNNDGLLDIAENDFSTQQLTVYLGMSNGPQFQAATSYQTQSGNYGACSNAFGDLNGDGFPEIVSVNCSYGAANDNTITIYLNNASGPGTFSAGVDTPVAMASSSQFPVYTEPYAATIADVNGDGNGDIVVSDYYSGDVVVMLGNGDGTVQSPSIGYATGGYPSTPALVADFNGDGLADIVVADYVYSFAYMKGYGDGTFQAGVDYYVPASVSGDTYSWDIATGDFNNDGIPDVVVGNWTDQGVTVFLSRGDGTLMSGVNYGAGVGLAYLAVGDFNKDGNLDVAAVDANDGLIQIFNGNGDGTFTTGAALPTNDSDSTKVVAADVNGDGYLDLVVANYNGHTVEVFLNGGSGAPGVFSAGISYPLSGIVFDVAVADLNGDGKPDLLLPISSTGNLAVLLGNGDGTFQPETNDSALGNNPEYIAVGDVNGDGKADVVATIDDYTNGMGIAVALGNGDGTFQAANFPVYTSTLQNTFAIQPYPYFIQLADLNGDGILDAVYTNANYGTVGVMYGNGDVAGTFQAPVEYPTGGYGAGIALADVNNDGAVDVITAGDDTAEASVLLNNTGSQELPNYTVTPNANTASVTPGQTATIMLTLTPRNFYNGTVSFACSGLPSESQCNFNALSLTPNGNAQMTSTLTITTTAPSTSMLVPMQGNPWSGNTTLLASFSTVGLLGLILVASSKKNRRMAVVLGTLALGVMIVTVGCGGGSSNNFVTPPPQTDPGTPAGTYTVTVTATGTAGTNGGSTAAHTFTVTLTVQ